MKVQFSSENLSENVEMKDLKIFSSSNIIEEKRWKLSNHILEASFCDFQCNDFNIFRTSIKSDENCIIKTKSLDKAYVCIGMPLRGSVDYRYNQIKSRNSENVWYKGFTNVVVSSQTDGYSRFAKKHPFDMIEILISPDFFKKISELYPDLFEESYKRMCTGESFFLSPENIQVTPMQAQIFQDIMYAKTMGNATKMYIESKIMENLSLFMSRINNICEEDTNVLSISDKDKMYQVRDIIRSQYQNLPSLNQLAVMVGTNEFKLKSAFKNIFGTTVFGYLFDYRMALASEYLLNTSLPIQEIALQIGYEHQSHFSSAFKRKFILSPLEYRKKNLNLHFQ